MASVRGYLKLTGSMGDTTFKKGKGKKNYANDKVVLNDARVSYDYQYSTLRKNASHFKNAAMCANLLRDSISELLGFAQDDMMTRRTYSEMIKVLKKDNAPGIEGRQTVKDENMVHMLGFNFNDNVKLRVAFNVAYRTKIDRETGELTIKISTFNPSTAVRGPENATHFKIVSNGVAINFADGKSKRDAYESALYKLDSRAVESFTIVHQLEPGSTDLLAIVLGLQFSDAGNLYYTTNKELRAVNPLSLVDVNFVGS